METPDIEWAAIISSAPFLVSEHPPFPARTTLAIPPQLTLVIPGSTGNLPVRQESLF